jgi:hypothetical protein
MARVKIDRMEALKKFVETLQSQYPTAKSYDRTTVESMGETNPVGFTAFASGSNGYGKMTRLSRGMYIVPADWETNAPWMTSSKPSTPAPKTSKKNTSAA